MNQRWVCPTCAAGCLAPSRPRLDDVRRYCLTCSKRTGRLVQRVCPAQERARQAATARRADKVARQQAKAKADAYSWPQVLHVYFRRWRKLDAWEGTYPERSTLVVRHSQVKGHSSGHCALWTGRIVVTTSDDPGASLATLLHEMAHAASREGHTPRFHAILLTAIEEVAGERALPVSRHSRFAFQQSVRVVMRRWIERVGLLQPPVPVPKPAL